MLATAVEEGNPRPMLWTFQASEGRVLGSVPGHDTWTPDDPPFRIPIPRGMARAAHEPAGRFERLALEGMRPAEE